MRKLKASRSLCRGCCFDWIVGLVGSTKSERHVPWLPPPGREMEWLEVEGAWRLLEVGGALPPSFCFTLVNYTPPCSSLINGSTQFDGKRMTGENWIVTSMHSARSTRTHMFMYQHTHSRTHTHTVPKCLMQLQHSTHCKFNLLNVGINAWHISCCHQGDKNIDQKSQWANLIFCCFLKISLKYFCA